MLSDTAATVALGVLEAIQPGEAPLVVGPGTAPLWQALLGQGAKPLRWTRFAATGGVPLAWPPPEPASGALIRMPKEREALEMTLHAVAARLPAGAPIALFGENGEGVRSADRLLEIVCDGVATLDTRRHCRVMAGRRRAAIADHKAALSDWREVATIDMGGRTISWVSYPGLFAHRRLDPGSAALIGALPALSLPAEPRVLDYGAGAGALSAGIRAQHANARLTLLDADALALEAARENVPGAELIVAADLTKLPAGAFDLIVSNPPVHAGTATDLGTVDSLIKGAPRCLAPGGSLVLVVQRRLPVKVQLEIHFGEVEALVDDGRYGVFRARSKPRRSDTARAPRRVPHLREPSDRPRRGKPERSPR